MFSRFTASARRVMQRAFREAKRWQHDFVGTEHLLYGLLCDLDGPAGTLLRSLQVAPDLLLGKVELSLQRHDGGLAMEQFPLSPASRRVFRSAADEAASFRHQMIGPEHLLLGLLRERDCEAAQILATHGIAFSAVREAIAQLPPDLYREAQIQADEAPRTAPGDNPSANELERRVAPPPKVEDVAQSPLLSGLPWAAGPAPTPLQELSTRLWRTQLVFGGLLGYTFGHWLSDWKLGLLSALIGVGVAFSRHSWVGLLVGTSCGLLITPLFRPDVGPWGPIVIGLLGAFLGSFLGDGLLTRKAPSDSHHNENDPSEPTG
ncbi:MAG: ATP-dependent Clp protease ATP-binding subunit [Planctomycetes bacterium]|nr:ATP-dependent Clp protease ATP-binding subunit [Planctomycetota bacterium]